MALIKSISGIRGTIGGKSGEGLTPNDILKFTLAYGTWVLKTTNNPKIVVGRDARISGEMVNHLVIGSLISIGIDVIDLGLSTTPTVELAVPNEKAGGGIIITSSHNPKQWNALKLLNAKGEFISDEEGKDVLSIADKKSGFNFAEVDKIGKVELKTDYIDWHIQQILNLPLVDVEAIKSKNYKIAIDAVNSTGGIAVPKLLKALGVKNIIEIYCEPTGHFPHNPEPLPENLSEISNQVIRSKADLGIVVDPDVDRLALVNEDGSMFGEEYTLVAVADYILQNKKGNTVSNLSSTRALRDVTEAAGGKYEASAVGEVNVVNLMKETKAVIGGEGNGGIIYPDLHYGRDALVGIALFLSHLAKSNKRPSILRSTYPSYYISKNKIELDGAIDVDMILAKLQVKYAKQPISIIDGVKIEFDKEWVHLRKSNTEPIIRIYSESNSETTANNIAKQIMKDVHDMI